MEAPLSSTSASVATAESERVCWLCLCGSEAGPLTLPCKCPSMYSHPACLGRWQLQSAGKEEERFCRFCHSSLPGWTQSLLDDPVAQPQKPAVPVMAVVFNGRVVKLPCTPGKEGAELFKKQIREIFQLDDTVNLDVTFELKVPTTKEQNRTSPTDQKDQKVYLKGFHTFEAASKVAAICAAKRMARKSSKSNSGDSLLRSTSTGLSDASSSGCSSSNAAGSEAAPVHRHVQRISAPPMVAVTSSSPSLPSAPPPSPTAHSATTSPGASAFSAASSSPCPAASEFTAPAWQQQRSAVRSSSAALPPLSVLNYAGSTSLSDPEPHPSYSLESRQPSLSPRNSTSDQLDQLSAQAPPARQAEVAPSASKSVSKSLSKSVSKSLSKWIVQRLKSLFD